MNVTKWSTKEKCQEEAIKYVRRIDFQKNSRGAYLSALKHNWLNDICSHMTIRKSLLNKTICQQEALKYKTKSEFAKNNKYCYQISLINNWLDEICSHMEIQGNLYKRLIYCYEFSDNHVYVGLTYNIEQRQKLRNLDNNDSVTKYINETKLIPERKILTGFLDVELAQKMEEFYVNKYKSEGWKILNKSKTGGIGTHKNIKWTKEACLESAKNFNTRTDWWKGELSAYDIAQKRYGKKFFEECCSHMKPTNYIRK